MPSTTVLSETQLASLESDSAIGRVEWALSHLPGSFVLSSSFGIQSAVLLHLVTQIKPDIPVLLVDTGYLFPETYRFIDQLTERLKLNLKVSSAPLSAAYFEARHGKLWEQGVEGIEQYNQMRKVDPMNQALDDLDVGTWFAGLRRQQSSSRQHRAVVEQRRDGRYKVYPLIDWHTRDVHRYLVDHDLPYHPLWEAGYVSVGDWHTSRPLTADMTEEDTRFFGLKRECGLHE
ncbi:phosphoadenosine phosphosulfate reductase [Terasakiispira papahanaumokuakeensis]|uniref:Phosphoadenosine 5'-phosphosulfate reductase n=1 Tax=Terasakiispira papahanaumokuakeensis TaxID=197479 RepID=A0A1E2VAW8_9GAMM|nr:phosphoadenylyl-sulfate reductase [Terasakiispira papahanaumokuakeensis]ODC04114.1 phosphoadenosine phosphosulfate reductase [Terasakiispira papahanaumokuakeensis]